MDDEDTNLLLDSDEDNSSNLSHNMSKLDSNSDTSANQKTLQELLEDILGNQDYPNFILSVNDNLSLNTGGLENYIKS